MFSISNRIDRQTVAIVQNRADDRLLKKKLNHLDTHKKTTLALLRNEKKGFQMRFSTSKYNQIEKRIRDENTRHIKPKLGVQQEKILRSIFDNRSESAINFAEINHMLFTDGEIDVEKILCLHLISAHRTESLTPPRKRIKRSRVHSTVDKLLERSKKRNLHLDQKMTNMLPIYTLEITERDLLQKQVLINDGRLATRILLNIKIRELVNTVLIALKLSNAEKSYKIFEMAEDVSILKSLFATTKILDFLDNLMTSNIVHNSEHYILTAPFRVKSIQIEIRTVSGSLENLISKVHQNVLQLPRRSTSSSRIMEDDLENHKPPESQENVRRDSSSSEVLRNVLAFKPQTTYEVDTQSRRNSDESKRKFVKHEDKNFIALNKNVAKNAKKVEYDDEDDSDYYYRPRRYSTSSTLSGSRRRSSGSNQSDVTNRLYLQPVDLTEVNTIMEEKELSKEESDVQIRNMTERASISSVTKSNSVMYSRSKRDKRVHLKQTTCPACMEKYKIPLPSPKTPRVKPSTVLSQLPDEKLDLTNNGRISMMINKELFKLQSYERKFTSQATSRRSNRERYSLEIESSTQLTSLELARIEQEIREKETQKKLAKFLDK